MSCCGWGFILCVCPSLCFQGRLQRICSAACSVCLAPVQYCWTPMAPPYQKPQARPGVWRCCRVIQVWNFSPFGCCALTTILYFHDSLNFVCLHACFCLLNTMGAGTSGVVSVQLLHKVCSCICHICVFMPVFQDKYVCACKRQLRASLEGPPGVSAPVVEQWEEKHKDSSCPQSLYTVSVLNLTLHCF